MDQKKKIVAIKIIVEEYLGKDEKFYAEVLENNYWEELRHFIERQVHV